jgi:hypothetical protein
MLELSEVQQQILPKDATLVHQELSGVEVDPGAGGMEYSSRTEGLLAQIHSLGNRAIGSVAEFAQPGLERIRDTSTQAIGYMEGRLPITSRKLIGTAALALAVTGAKGAFEARAAAHTTPAAPAAALKQPYWLRKHCPIAVTVAVSAGRDANRKSGVSLHGVKTELPEDGFPEPAVLYTWRISKRDRFCGIVGSENGYPIVSNTLRPDTTTARGGKYIDWSFTNPSGSGQWAKVTVYAKPIKRQHKK